MNTNSLAIATISWARNEDEESLLRQSLQQLSTLNIPVYITDGGSGDSFINFLNSFQNFTVLKAAAKGVCAQAKNSMEAAHQSGADYILYTEPDKLQFFQSLPSIIANASVDEKTGVILMSRSKTGFATFPAFQQMTETTINNCCKEIIGKDVDYTYGPFIINRNIIPYLRLIKEDVGWGWRPFAFSAAYQSGYDLTTIERDFLCPSDQQIDNPGERVYRMKQLQQNIHGIVLSKMVQLK